MRAVVAVLLFVTAVHAALWGVLRDKQEAPDFKGMLPSVSYAPFEGTGASRRRQYSQRRENPRRPEKAGAADAGDPALLLDRRRRTGAADRSRIRPQGHASAPGSTRTPSATSARSTPPSISPSATATSSASSSATRRSYRGEQKVEDLIELIKQVKKSVNVPVTTGEIWNIWRDNPELASSVDFIAAHVLPYWENFTDKQAVDQAVYLYGLLRDKFPGKRIVIAEFGWPSAGYNLKNADPGPFEQASVLRNFVTRAEAIGMEYNIVEAIDQPWKFFEGGVGPYWGILNAAREPKFAWTGPIVNENYWKLATIALLVGILLSLPILRLPDATVMQALVLSAAANGVGAWVATVFAYWDGHYFVFGSAFALTLGLILLVPLVLIAMARIEEIAAIAFGRDAAPADRQGRQAGAGHHRRGRHLPKGLDPHPRLFRAAGDAQADARCGVAAGLSEFRMRRDHQQHAGSGILAADPGSLPRARRALQVHQRREGRRLQGRRAAHRHGAHRRRCRDHRHHRRRLCRAAGLAEGSGAGVRRSPRRPRAGAAGPSRRRHAR